MANSLFAQAIYTPAAARHMRGRVELISQDVANELNTYRNFGIFHTYNDVHTIKWDDKGEIVPPEGGNNADNRAPGTPGVRSIFNKLSAVLTGADSPMKGGMKENIGKYVVNASSWRLSNNVPLLDTPENRKKLRANSGCTVRELVKASQTGHFGTAVYSYADFMYCRYLGKVPNNYLITLRRYPMPIADSMNPIGVGSSRRMVARDDKYPVPIGTMVTWLGVSGNDMKNILKYSYKMAFEEKNAQWEDIEKQGGDSGLLNGMEALSNPAARKSWQDGHSVPALDNFMNTFFNAGGSPYPAENTGSEVQKDKTKIYGPIDRVKKAYARSAAGLDWDHEFNIVFEYELKAYNGINPRQAMLDLIASILSVTYTTGGFWGGGYRGGGIRQSSWFSNLNIFKASGGFTNFMDALSKDVRAGVNNIRKDISSAGGLLEYAKSMLNMIGGMLMGGVLNKLGRPARYFANSLISDAPVGLWHITIGNPHHPIMSMGNMILLNTEIEHSGPLGLDDFPTNLKVTCQFKRGKPRDQYGIENLYMSGNDRIFHSMSKKLGDMYRVAAKYKDNPDANPKQIQGGSGTPNTEKAAPKDAYVNQNNANGVVSKTKSQVTEASGPADKTDGTHSQAATAEQVQQANELESNFKAYADLQNQWMYWFGMTDASTAITAAEEAGMGSAKAVNPEKPDIPKTDDANKDTQNQSTDTDNKNVGDKKGETKNPDPGKKK